ncbi:hypothetical protein Acr_11g0017280 [Actinidia rufa]|uniref:Uncharacterized protein n=1 Tax=Actinidia rufa TaxID=165716 RepID=A0A7J0FFE7_9ERIC|nr:hypothetical protein Acr_11g0017280 [Actinidia rufa]
MWLVTSSPWAQQLVSEPSSSHRRVTGAIFGGERKPILNFDQIRSAQKWRLSIPPDSSRRDEAPAPNGVKIGLQTSPHAPPEVRRVRSTRPTRAREVSDFDRRALSEFSRRSGFIREHDEMSAHGLWTKLEEMYREKTSQNKALLRRLVLKLQRGTIVAEQTSEFQRATGRGQKKRSEKESQEGGHRGQEKRRDKKNCPRNKAPDQSSEAATTAMMAVDESDVLLAASADKESDWISDSGIAYHLCRDREWRNTQSFQGKQEKLQEKEDWKAIPTRENVQTGELLSDIVPVIHSGTGAQEMLWDTCGSLARHEKVQPLQDVHEEAQRRETESMHNDRRDVAGTSLFRSRSVAVISLVVHTREEDGVTKTTCKATYFAEHPVGSRAPK